MDDTKRPNGEEQSPDTPRSHAEGGDLGRGDPATRTEYQGRSGGGDSGGGAYPNPHTGQKPRDEGFMGHGGQSDMAYYGKGQLGEDKIGENANAPAGDE